MADSAANRVGWMLQRDCSVPFQSRLVSTSLECPNVQRYSEQILEYPIHKTNIVELA
jgi:hypothetical protein